MLSSMIHTFSSDKQHRNVAETTRKQVCTMRKVYLSQGIFIVLCTFSRVAHPHDVYAAANRHQVSVHPSSGLFEKQDVLDWVVFHEVVWTSRPYMRTITPVVYSWVGSVPFSPGCHTFCGWSHVLCLVNFAGCVWASVASIADISIVRCSVYSLSTRDIFLVIISASNDEALSPAHSAVQSSGISSYEVTCRHLMMSVGGTF